MYGKMRLTAKRLSLEKKHEGWCKLTQNCFAVINDFPKQRSEDE